MSALKRFLRNNDAALLGLSVLGAVFLAFSLLIYRAGHFDTCRAAGFSDVRNTWNLHSYCVGFDQDQVKFEVPLAEARKRIKHRVTPRESP